MDWKGARVPRMGFSSDEEFQSQETSGMEEEALYSTFYSWSSSHLFTPTGLVQYLKLHSCHRTPRTLVSDGNEIQFRSTSSLFAIS